jgi:hypothetical protein
MFSYQVKWGPTDKQADGPSYKNMCMRLDHNVFVLLLTVKNSHIIVYLMVVTLLLTWVFVTNCRLYSHFTRR